MIGLCSKCNNLAELHDGLCAICKAESEIKTDAVKNAESVVKDASRKIFGRKKDMGFVAEEGS